MWSATCPNLNPTENKWTISKQQFQKKYIVFCQILRKKSVGKLIRKSCRKNLVSKLHKTSKFKKLKKNILTR